MQRYAETEQGLAIFHNNPSVSDFLMIDSLVNTTYRSFKVIRSAYDEMLNEGSFYGIRNRALRNAIDEFYVEASNAQQAFLDINMEGLDLATGNPALNNYDLLIYYLENSPETLNGIDTS